MKRILPFLLLLGCSEPVEPDTCPAELPAEAGRSCSADGECGEWLICDSGACGLPAAVSGEGGEIATISGDVVNEIRVEVARSDLARSRGLGGRPCLADGWGLILEFPDPGAHQITTQTMRFNIDIAMLDQDGEVIALIEDAPAGGKALYGADRPVAAVLETPAGALPIAVGDVVAYSSTGGG